MSEFLLVSRSMVRVLPETLPLRRAALAEPLAVGMHGITLAGGVEGKTVLVTGSGPIGLLTAAAALADGAAEVTTTDVLTGPLKRARALGVHRTIDVTTAEIPVEAFDVVLECSSAPASINAGFAAVRRAGTYIQIGMVPDELQGINLTPVITKELTLHGSFRFKDEIDAAIVLLNAEPRIERLVTHEMTAGRAVEAFAVAKDSQTSGKVLISFVDR